MVLEDTFVFMCPYSRLTSIPPRQNRVLTVDTKHGTSWRLLLNGSMEFIQRQNRSSLICELEPSFGEFGVYDLVISGTESGDVLCSMTTAKEPVNIYLPLILCLMGLAIIWLLFLSGSSVTRKWLDYRRRIIEPTSGSQVASASDGKNVSQHQSPQRLRLKSLDTFRGISVVLMIFVNDGAGGYWFLEHATWNGLQLADLLFPWFMWIMGVCIPISVRSQLKRNVPRSTMFLAVLRRASILFLLGLVLNSLWGSRLETMRVFGVLQRFGLVYFVVATLCVFLTCRSYRTPKIPFLAASQDIVVLLPQWILMVGVVAGHLALTFYLDVPGCPKGYLGPGGVQDKGQFKGCVGGATGYLDRLILGENHIYQHPTARKVYGSGPFDPEGLTGCLLSVFQVFLGVQAGTTLSFYSDWKGRVTRWSVWGAVVGISAGILCLASKDEGWIPINKNLWSLSFVLATSCLAFFLLAACYVLIDVRGWWSGAPFFYPGMNATIMYVGHSVAFRMFPWHWSLGTMNTHFILLIESLWGTALWVLVGLWLHNIKFFLSL
ncbi:heparan-alpha-glucosaminide N-acetyltransferase isoform X2 [Zootermopsis nevadensis]|uniref:heparan-alpha-glucosaminide N-acetyltransferase isoform X2 n=1 Tax=Zootermopsis nevadensis TaxID=136037 RepID=UPI000B8EBA7D|nr:heparan-alpha-glucosaminide N-acetyltransferase isoform X2 [Zootermopsis nevadensis]